VKLSHAHPLENLYGFRPMDETCASTTRNIRVCSSSSSVGFRIGVAEQGPVNRWFLYIEFEMPAGVTYQVETVVGLRYFTVCKPEIVQK
jgi:hypothetical protein